MCSMVIYTHAKNITSKFEFSLMFPNIDAWAIEGICTIQTRVRSEQAKRAHSYNNQALKCKTLGGVVA